MKPAYLARIESGGELRAGEIEHLRLQIEDTVADTEPLCDVFADVFYITPGPAVVTGQYVTESD